MIAHVPECYETSVLTNKYRRNGTAFPAIESPIRSNDNDADYCQIYCQIGGFEGIAGDKSCQGFNNLLISMMPPPSSNPSLSAKFAERTPRSSRYPADIVATGFEPENIDNRVRRAAAQRRRRTPAHAGAGGPERKRGMSGAAANNPSLSANILNCFPECFGACRSTFQGIRTLEQGQRGSTSRRAAAAKDAGASWRRRSRAPARDERRSREQSLSLRQFSPLI
jgi:hypothetical protein